MNRRQSYAHSAFALVEVMIVIVIIGLLAAMAIPAFIKVRAAAIQKAIAAGAHVSEGDREWLRKHGYKTHQSNERQNDETEQSTPATRSAPPGLKTLESNGTRYYLIPKTSSYPNEMTIGSDTYYMVPVPNGS